MLRLLLLLSALTYTIPNLAFSQVEFQRHTIFSELRGAYWVHAIDVDGDGDLDLVSAAFDGIDWWENDGNQNFSQRSVDTQMQGAWSAHADDMDNDGDIDILACSPTDDEVVLWLNDGQQNFDDKIVIDNKGQDPETVLTTDLDQDGNRDIMVAMWESRHIVWYRNKGDGVFEKNVVERDMKGAHSVAAGDLDGDGDVDLVANGSSETNWYMNTGNQSFVTVPLSATGGLVIHTTDLDQDGDMDILRSQRDNGDIDWFENDGAGSFTERNIATEFGDCWSVRTGDVDADGDLDVAAAGFEANNITVWLNDGTETFGPGIVLGNVNTPRFVQIADIDGDGDGDVAAAIRDDRDLAWYEKVGSPPPPKSLTLVAPASGDTLLAASQFEVNWTSTGEIADVRIEFSADNGQSWNQVVTVPNSGSYLWSVPDISSPFALLRISGSLEGEPSVQHETPFTVLRAQDFPRRVTLVSPNGGERMFIDSTFTVTWVSEGPVTLVGLEFSADNGLQWIPIVSQTQNDGSYAWNVPDVPSQTCLLRVTDVEDPSVFDGSDANFAIERFVVPQTITVVSPATGESIWADSSFVIAWNSTGEISNVRLDFSADSGLSWSVIDSSAPNAGSFLWTVPDTSSQNCLIRIADAADSVPSTLSPGAFTIRRMRDLAPEIRSFEPISGPPGTLVTLRGKQFSEITRVDISGVSAPFAMVSDTVVVITIPQAATTGFISATNFAGTGVSLSAFEVSAGLETVTLFFPPTDDAQVKLDSPGRNYGDKLSFKVELGSFQSYLKFKVDGVAGRLVSATLQLIVSAPSSFGGRLHHVSNDMVGSSTPWTEDSLSFDNAPLVTGSPIDSVEAVTLGEKVQFDVQTAISGDSTISFALTSSSGDQVEYHSKESDFAPKLVVVIEREGNIAPYAQRDHGVTFEDTPVTVEVLANDVDPDGNVDALSLAIVAPPSSGSATLSAGQIEFTPQQDFFGEDSLAYTVSDDAGKVSNAAILHLTVLPVNDIPVAVPDSILTLWADSIAVPVLGNDFDIDDELKPASVRIVRGSQANAVLHVSPETGVVFYLPALHFSGVDSFAYTVEDNAGAVSNEALVKILLQDGNRPPVAVNDSVDTAENVAVVIPIAANDTDPEGNLDLTSVTISTQPVSGTVSIDEQTGAVSYMPNPGFRGTDTFGYTIEDAFDLLSNEATVLVRVGHSNHAPEITGFTPELLLLALQQNETKHFSVTASDADGDALTYSWVLRNELTGEQDQVSSDSEYLLNATVLQPAGYSLNAAISDGDASATLEWRLDVVSSVELTQFEVHFAEFTGAQISWSTSRESRNSGFNLLRSQSETGEFVRLNDELLNPREDGLYEFIDPDVTPGSYFYTLEDVDINGRKSLHGPIAVEIAVPRDFSVSRNYPNPFNPETRIRFELPSSGRIVLAIYNVVGQLVKTLADESMEAGFHVASWDGRNENGQVVGSGIYYYRVNFQSKSFTGRMLLMK